VIPPALRAALVSLCLVLLALEGLDWYAHDVARRYVAALAPLVFEQKDQGALLLDTAFAQPDLLPLYGSSELRIADPDHPSTLFRTYPTGFAVFPVGKADTTCLVMLEKLAAAGPDLRGKKVAIVLSPVWFFGRDQADPAGYAGNFSRLQANALAYSTDLSFDLKQAAAVRMLQYPATLDKDPLLKFSLQQLAAGSLAGGALYYASLPLGRLQTLVLRLQDDWETLRFVTAQVGLTPAVAHQPAPLPWRALTAQAAQDYSAQANNNPFGFANSYWSNQAGVIQRTKNQQTDKGFLHVLRHNKEWTDLDLLLRELQGAGAQPLLISLPIAGTYYNYAGVSATARKQYYTQLSAVAKKYGVPLQEFADHDQDRYFLIDDGSHLSPKGWMYVDQTLDAFYHGTFP